MNRLQILQGDCVERLRELPNGSVHCCVTSPPYWGLRDYGVEGQLGLEKTPEEYVAKMVAVFEEVRRVLRDDGTLWVNMGDSYNNGPNANRDGEDKRKWSTLQGGKDTQQNSRRCGCDSLKPKDLCGIPWRLAFALQAAGWYLRSEIIWAKRNCMPESVTDRPAKSHEQIFLLSKSEQYFYDNEAVKVPASESYANDSRWETGSTELNYKDGYADALAQNPKMPHRVFDGERRNMVNLRDVWQFTSQPYPESHFATFPEELPRRCILAGTSAKGCCPHCGAPWERMVESQPISGGTEERKANGHPSRYGDTASKAGSTEDGTWSMPHFETKTKTTGWQPTCDCGYGTLQPCTVLDPFGGSGTTGQVALELGRKAILIELNPRYVELIRKRCDVTPGLPLA